MVCPMSSQPCIKAEVVLPCGEGDGLGDAGGGLGIGIDGIIAADIGIGEGEACRCEELHLVVAGCQAREEVVAIGIGD